MLHTEWRSKTSPEVNKMGASIKVQLHQGVWPLTAAEDSRYVEELHYLHPDYEDISVNTAIYKTGGSETCIFSGISLPNLYLGTVISGCSASNGAGRIKFCFLNTHYIFGTSLITLPVLFCALGDKAPNTAVSSTGQGCCSALQFPATLNTTINTPSYKIWFTGTFKAASCQGMFLNEGKEYLNTSMTWQPFLLFISYYTLQRKNILQATF